MFFQVRVEEEEFFIENQKLMKCLSVYGHVFTAKTTQLSDHDLYEGLLLTKLLSEINFWAYETFLPFYLFMKISQDEKLSCLRVFLK